ncbi:AI-2E family transporter, partial [Staphylococcus xylosus]|nr:AI-2E family transporter [Staphylococcus xylosus]
MSRLKPQNYSGSIADSLSSLAGTAANAAITAAIIPFALYYMLKEGLKPPGDCCGFFRKNIKKKENKSFGTWMKALSSYIQGQLLEFLCRRSRHNRLFYNRARLSLVLGAFAMVTNLIP